jgi:hypothetical protein
VRDYLDWMRRHRKSGDATEVMLNAYVLSSAIGEKRLRDLSAADLDRARRRTIATAEV